MKKLINGIIQFRKQVTPEQLQKYSKLALEQKPDSLFIACSDSRVVPNLFASTDPGDLFVVRNMGNLVPAANLQGDSSGDVSEIAALEFSILTLKIKDIIVCGHSECGAMQALLVGKKDPLHITKWIQHASPCLNQLESHRKDYAAGLSDINVLSQMNVLQQIQHLETYPLIKNKMARGELQLHAWWFDIATASVYVYNQATRAYEILK